MIKKNPQLGGQGQHHEQQNRASGTNLNVTQSRVKNGFIGKEDNLPMKETLTSRLGGTEVGRFSATPGRWLRFAPPPACAARVERGQTFSANRFPRFSCIEMMDQGWISSALHVIRLSGTCPLKRPSPA
jgi:hypothetical protein